MQSSLSDGWRAVVYSGAATSVAPPPPTAHHPTRLQLLAPHAQVQHLQPLLMQSQPQC